MDKTGGLQNLNPKRTTLTADLDLAKVKMPNEDRLPRPRNCKLSGLVRGGGSIAEKMTWKRNLTDRM